MTAVAVWAAATAWPCAGLVHEEGKLAESGGAEVLFEPAANAVTYAVTYQGDAADFGWVIPTDGPPAAVEDGDAALFSALRGLSSPEYEYPPEAYEDGGCGCGPSSKGDSTPGGLESNDVEIVAEGFTGTYEWIAVDAGDPTALDAWLADHGWTGLVEEDLQHYVERGSTFLAVRVLPTVAQTPAEGRELPPLRIVVDGDAMMFPAVLARGASSPTQRTTLYVLGSTRAVLSGWSYGDQSLITEDATDPLAVWEQALAERGAEAAYLRSYAGPYEGAFLTRFDTLAPREVHDQDVELALEDSTDPVSTRIVLTETATTRAALLLLPVALGAWRRRSVRA